MNPTAKTKLFCNVCGRSKMGTVSGVDCVGEDCPGGMHAKPVHRLLEGFAQAALCAYTPKSQMEMAEEECAEFIVAMRHLQRGRAGSTSAVRGEIADVIIMMAQMRHHFGPEAIDAIIERKISREANRINDPNYSPERKQREDDPE